MEGRIQTPYTKLSYSSTQRSETRVEISIMNKQNPQTPGPSALQAMWGLHGEKHQTLGIQLQLWLRGEVEQVNSQQLSAILTKSVYAPSTNLIKTPAPCQGEADKQVPKCIWKYKGSNLGMNTPPFIYWELPLWNSEGQKKLFLLW